MARTVVGKGPRPINLERLGRYRIVRPLSKGGMALVFEHYLRHQGAPVSEGSKYVLRSDVMFRA